MSWESKQCLCEISKVTAFYMKYTTRWYACKEGVKVGDYNLLAIEGCDWIEFWAAKAVGKPNYLLETKRRIESTHNLEPWQREYKLLNQFFRMVQGANLISNNDFCEKHNDEAKQCPPEPNFAKMCANSKHLQGSMRAEKWFFGDNTKQHTLRSNMQDKTDLVSILSNTPT